MPIPAVTEPPGELMKSLMSLVGSWESRRRSWETMASALKSETSPPRKIMRWRARRPKGSPAMSCVLFFWMLRVIGGERERC